MKKNGEPYLHLPMIVENVTDGTIHAGHVNQARISLTGEFILQIIDRCAGRTYSAEVGLNLFCF